MGQISPMWSQKSTMIIPWLLLNIYSLIGNNMLNVHFSVEIVFYTTHKTPPKLYIEFPLKHGGWLDIKVCITRGFIGLKQEPRGVWECDISEICVL